MSCRDPVWSRPSSVSGVAKVDAIRKFLRFISVEMFCFSSGSMLTKFYYGAYAFIEHTPIRNAVCNAMHNHGFDIRTRISISSPSTIAPDNAENQGRLLSHTGCARRRNLFRIQDEPEAGSIKLGFDHQDARPTRDESGGDACFFESQRGSALRGREKGRKRTLQ
jgi:hypothetical protein